jgi:uncharacterized SAM-binding protein YcdF (DUF218 family)
MIDAFVTVLKDGWRLSSPLLMLALAGIGVALLYVRRAGPWGRRWLTASAVAYWILSTPVGARLISAPLARGHGGLAVRQQAEGASAVVVLGGGILSYTADGMALDDLRASAYRVIEGVRVYKLLGDPLLIVSGGNTQRLDSARPESAALTDAAVRLGVPAARVLGDDESRTTREQALVIKRLLAERGIALFVLVTSPIHMGRSLAAFRAVGLNPTASSSRLRGDAGETVSLVPDRESLFISDAALYEYVAWTYYWARGWVRPPGAG